MRSRSSRVSAVVIASRVGFGTKRPTVRLGLLTTARSAPSPAWSVCPLGTLVSESRSRDCLNLACLYRATVRVDFLRARLPHCRIEPY